jgi:6-phosphogluconate dehydrogenase
VTHVGTGSAGHFVKMVHNGIEYGDMQLIAECYDLMQHVLGMAPAQIADTFTKWNADVRCESFLIEITAKVLRVNDPTTKAPLVDAILDKAGQKGTGKWTAKVALRPTESRCRRSHAAVDARVPVRR